MTVSLCIVALNEEEFLPRILADVAAQTYPHELTEVVLVDSGSSDGTRRIMLDFAAQDNGFIAVKIRDNPKKIQAAGWNVALDAAVGDVIVRLDAHARIPADFVAKNVALQEKGELITGGIRPPLVDRPTSLKNTLLEVESSLFGSSIGANRRGAVSGYVKTMFHAAYRREVFERVGRFNEALLRTEDNEMHYRIRRAGYRLFCTSDIVSYQYVRPSFRAMIKQKYANGSWVGTTLWVCPLCLSPYHLAPLAFLFAIVVTSVLAAFGLWQLSALMWSAYLVLCLLAMLSSVVRRTANVWTPLLPLMFLTLHVAYGVGTLCGLFRKI